MKYLIYIAFSLFSLPVFSQGTFPSTNPTGVTAGSFFYVYKFGANSPIAIRLDSMAQKGLLSFYLPLSGGTMTGNILFTDNSFDIGASGATRPRTGYFGTSVVSPLILGGTSTTQAITYKTTTGVGATGADHIFQVGNNGSVEGMRIYNAGNIDFSGGRQRIFGTGALDAVGASQTTWSNTLGQYGKIHVADDGDVDFYADASPSLTLGSTGSVGINNSTIASSAVLDIASTTQGLLTPRMTVTQINAISTPATGLLAYNTSENTFKYYNGSEWKSLLDSTAVGGNYWKIGGNTGTGYKTIGNTGNASLNFISNNTKGGQLDSLGQWRFGQFTPTGTSAWHTFGGAGGTQGIKINGTSTAYLLLSNSNAEGTFGGGVSLTSTSMKLFTPAQKISINTAGTDRLGFGTTGRIFSENVTDYDLTASDSARFYGLGLTTIGHSSSNLFASGTGFVGVFQGNASYGALGNSLFTAGNIGSFISTDSTILGTGTHRWVLNETSDVVQLYTNSTLAQTVNASQEFGFGITPSSGIRALFNGMVRANGKILSSGTGNTPGSTAANIQWGNTNGSSTFDAVLQDDASLDFVSNNGTTVLELFNNDVKAQGRFQTKLGSNTAAANDLTLPNTGNVFHITGATQINAITTTNWQAGSEVTFIFDSTPTVKNNTAGGAGTAIMLLAGGADFLATANDVLKLVYDGTSWFEVSRSVN